MSEETTQAAQVETAKQEQATPAKTAIDQWFDEVQEFVDFTDSELFRVTLNTDWIKPHFEDIGIALHKLSLRDAAKEVLALRKCDQSEMKIDEAMTNVVGIFLAHRTTFTQMVNAPTRNAASVAGTIAACLSYRHRFPNDDSILTHLRLRQRIAEIQSRFTAMDNWNAAADKASEAVTKFEESARQISAKIEASALEAKQAAVAAGQATGIAATNAHAKRHVELADHARRHADTWTERALGCALVLLASMFVLPFASPAIPAQATTPAVVAELIRVFSGKLAVLSLLLYGLSVCVKNYRAHTHNALIHEHRAAVFATFESFVKSASESAQDVVLVQTLQLVLAQQPTGFLTNEPDIQPTSQMADLIEKISKLKGGKD